MSLIIKSAFGYLLISFAVLSMLCVLYCSSFAYFVIRSERTLDVRTKKYFVWVIFPNRATFDFYRPLTNIYPFIDNNIEYSYRD